MGFNIIEPEQKQSGFTVLEPEAPPVPFQKGTRQSREELFALKQKEAERGKYLSQLITGLDYAKGMLPTSENILNAPANLVNGVVGIVQESSTVPQVLPTVKSGQPIFGTIPQLTSGSSGKLGEDMARGLLGGLNPETLKPLINQVINLVNAAQTPEGITSLPLFLSGAPLAQAGKAYMGSEMINHAANEGAAQAGEATGTLGIDPVTKTTAQIAPVVEAVLGALMGHTPAEAKSGIRWEDIQGLKFNELMGEPPKELPQYTQTTLDKMQRDVAPRYNPAYQLPERSGASQESRFVTDPIGHVVDMSQLSPLEQQELMRGPREYVPPRQGIRPAQEAPPIIGGQPPIPISIRDQIAKLLEQGQIRMGEIQPIERPPAKEGLGGQVSFAAPAQAGGIPSAGQAAYSGIDPTKVFTEMRRVAEEAKFVPAQPKQQDLFRPLDAARRAMEDATTYKVSRTKGREGVFYGTDVNEPTTAKSLPKSGESIRTIEGTAHEGTGSDAPVADAVDMGLIKLPEDIQKLIDTKNFSDETWDKDLAGLIALKEQGVEIAHFPDKDNPSKVVSVDLRNFDLERARKELASNMATPVERATKRPEAVNEGSKSPTEVSVKPDATPKSGERSEPSALVQQEMKLHSGVSWDDIKDVFTHQASKLVRTEFPNATQLDSQQVKNRLRNKLGEQSAEWKMWQQAGIEKFLSEGKKSPEEVQKWMKENGLQVGVHTYGMEGKVSEAKREYDKMTHEWYDNLNTQQKNKVLAGKIPDGTDAQVADKYIKLREKVMSEIVRPLPHATTAYEHVSALPTNEPMPEWTTSKEGKNVQRVDVVIPQKDVQSKNTYDDGKSIGTYKEAPLWQPDNLHENLPNTLGWAMIQYKTGPKGEKIAVIAEAQSRWAQSLRRDRTEVGYDKGTPNHPLLRDYNRLILKAAIEQARKEGATHIMVSNAETAMMTEGHDLAKRITIEPTEKNKQWAKEQYDKLIEPPENKQGYQHWLQQLKDLWTSNKSIDVSATKESLTRGAELKDSVDQEPGMRLNYDTILPKIMEELTGQKGKKVRLGEHKNAYEREQRRGQDPVNGFPEREYISDKQVPRQNLIFKNPDGTPKTDVSGTMFPIEGIKFAERRASGEPMTMMGKMYSGVDPTLIKDIVDTTTKFAQKVVTHIQQSPVRENVKAAKDATINMARNKANEMTNDVRGPLLRAFGLKDPQEIAKLLRGKAQEAYNNVAEPLTLAIEAGGDIKKLKELRQKVETSTDAIPSEKKRWLELEDKAEAQWAELLPFVKRYKDVTDAQVQLERSAGHRGDYRENYVMHLAEDAGDITSFTGKREFNTLADRVAAGMKAGSYDSIELLRSRLARGQQVYVQSKVFDNFVSRVKDNKTGLPLVIDKWKEGDPVPKGYEIEHIAGSKKAVLSDYRSVLTAMYDPSGFLRGDVGKTLLEARGVQKHLTLLFDFYHGGRITQRAGAALLGTGNVPKIQYKTGILVRDNSVAELQARAKAGEFTPEQLTELLDRKKVSDLMARSGLNSGRIADAFNQHFAEKIPLSGDFARFLFERYQAGLMEDLGYKVFDTYRKQYKGTDEQIARRVARDLNVSFGALGNQSILARKTYRDIAQMALLAPQWTEGSMRLESGAVKGTLGGLADVAQGKTPRFNLQARIVGTQIIGYLVANQLINIATTGKPTWDNEEGHKLDAWIPSPSGQGGYWLNPVKNTMELISAFGDAIQKQEGQYSDSWKAWLETGAEATKEVIGNKLSAAARPLVKYATGKQYGLTGQLTPKEDRFSTMVSEELLPRPIGTEAIGGLLKGDTKPAEKQIASWTGAKLQDAQTARQKIYQLANKWKAQNSIPAQQGEFAPSKYLDVVSALRRGDIDQAKEAYAKFGSQKEQDLAMRYFKNYTHHAFTGSKANEDKFITSLSAEQRKTYDEATKANEQVQERFFQMVGQPIPKKKEKKFSIFQ